MDRESVGCESADLEPVDASSPAPVDAPSEASADAAAAAVSDRELWTALMAEVRRACRRACRTFGPEKKVRYAARLVVSMYCWSVWHDRCLSWACGRDHYGALFRPRNLPSVSQFCRRVKSGRVQHVLQLLHEQLARPGRPAALSFFDGKLMTVGMHSKDADATKVRTNAGYVRGYRLHAWATEDGRIVVWSVTGAHAGEQTVAEAMCERLPPLPPDAVGLGDVRYDSATLHAAFAARGGALLTPLQGMAASEKKRRAMGPARRAAVETWEGTAAPVARIVLRLRTGIERIFGVLVCTTGGLAGLPAWVRTLDRVKRWVGVKVALYNLRLALRQAKPA